jgi:hypothetical protein
MSQMQEIEINRYHNRIVKDVSHLIERYREIMAWDVPENDPVEADKLIFKAVYSALEDLKKASTAF